MSNLSWQHTGSSEEQETEAQRDHNLSVDKLVCPGCTDIILLSCTNNGGILDAENSNEECKEKQHVTVESDEMNAGSQM
jgi:hypothetical protein